jgi:hypothetical protein
MVLGYLSEALRASWPATFVACRVPGLNRLRKKSKVPRKIVKYIPQRQSRRQSNRLIGTSTRALSKPLLGPVFPQPLKAPVFWSSSFREVETPRSLRQGIESATPYLLESCIGNPLHLFSSLPMNPREESLTMQVSVDVSDAMRREAESRGLPIIDYVELLVEKGRQAMGEGAVLSSALERIRALSSKDISSRS